MSWLGEQFTSFFDRTEPGRGAALSDDNSPSGGKLRVKSIPNYPTGYLERSVASGHESLHTAEGISHRTEDRRALIEASARNKMAAHELTLRGVQPGDCPHCWGGATWKGRT